MTDCPMCGTTSSGTTFCEKCGTRLAPVAPANAAPPPPAVAPAAPPTPAPAPPSGPMAPSASTSPTSSAPSRRGARKPPRTALLVGAGVVAVLAVAGLGVGIGLAAGNDTEPSANSTSVVNDPTSAAPTSNAPSSGVPTSGETPEGPARVCWDGSQVRGTETCPIATGPNAIRYAFPQVDFNTCASDAGVGDHFHPGWSYRCHWRGHEFHIAEYVDEAARTERLAEYGPCNPPGVGLCVAGPTALGNRYVKTYADFTGLLFYVSSPDGMPALSQLLPRSADVMLNGRALP